MTVDPMPLDVLFRLADYTPRHHAAAGLMAERSADRFVGTEILPARTIDAAAAKRIGGDGPFLERSMARFVAGDRQLFAAIFRHLAPRVAAGLRLMTGDPALAEDLTQATFLKVLRARDTYRPGMGVERWVWTIARRTLIDERRKRARRSEVLVADVTDSTPTSPEDPSDPRVERLVAAFQVLLPAQREALLLLKVHGLSAAEAAATAGTTVGAIKMRAQRGYETLRQLLDPGTQK